MAEARARRARRRPGTRKNKPARAKAKRVPAPDSAASLHGVVTLMDDYAKRGLFRGFHRRPSRGGLAVFDLVWHYDLNFQLIADTRKKTLSIPMALPHVPARSQLYKDFRSFVESRHDANLPQHRRVDPAKAHIRCANRGGGAALTVSVRDGDYNYALQRLIHLVHETFLLFLVENYYLDYLVDRLGAKDSIG